MYLRLSVVTNTRANENTILKKKLLFACCVIFFVIFTSVLIRIIFKMKKNIIWIAAAAAAIYFIIKKSSFAKNLIFSFNNIKPVGKWFQPELIITLSVQNPTRQAARITAISGTLYLDDKAISNIASFNPQIIQPQMESLISFSAKPGIIGIANIIKEIFTGTKSKQYRFKFIGTANVDGVLLPIDQEFIL